jgi:hypothetical protein
LLIENQYQAIEHRVAQVIDATTIELNLQMPVGFTVADGTQVIHVKRFIFNSYPKSINYGKTSKGTLLKAAVIDWFGWECEVPPGGGQGWTDPQLV